METQGETSKENEIGKLPGLLGLDTKIILLIIFTLSLLIRVSYTLLIRIYFSEEIINDELINEALALNILYLGKYKLSYGYCAYSSPGFALFLAAIFKTFGQSHLLAGIFNSAVSSLVPVFIFLTAGKIFNARVALLSSIVAVFYPYYIYYSPLLLTESFTVLLPLISIYFIIRFRERFSYSDLALSALFMGLASLFKPVTIFFPVAAAIYVFLGSRRFRTGLLQAGVYSLVFLAVMSPWAIRNYYRIGSPVFTNTNSGKTFLGSNYFYSKEDRLKTEIGSYRFDTSSIEDPDLYKILSGPEAERNTGLFKVAMRNLIKNYPRIPKLLLMKFIKFWSARPDPLKDNYTKNDYLSLLSYGPLGIFFFIGFVKLWRPREPVFIFHITVMYFTFIVLTILWGSPRFRLPISPYIIMMACSMIYIVFASHFTKKKIAQ